MAAYRESPSLDQRLQLLDLEAARDSARRRATYEKDDYGLAGDFHTGVDAFLDGYVAMDKVNQARETRKLRERELQLREQQAEQDRRFKEQDIQRRQRENEALGHYDEDASRLYRALAPYEREERAMVPVQSDDPERETPDGGQLNMLQLNRVRAQARTREEAALRMQELEGPEGLKSMARLERYQPGLIERQALRTPAQVELEDRQTVGRKRLVDLMTGATNVGPEGALEIAKRGYAIAQEAGLPEAKEFATTLFKVLEENPAAGAQVINFHGQTMARLMREQNMSEQQAMRMASQEVYRTFPWMATSARGKAIMDSIKSTAAPANRRFQGPRGAIYEADEAGTVSTLRPGDPQYFTTPRGGLMQINADGTREQIRRGDPRYMAIMGGGSVIMLPDDDGGGAGPDPSMSPAGSDAARSADPNFTPAPPGALRRPAGPTGVQPVFTAPKVATPGTGQGRKLTPDQQAWETVTQGMTAEEKVLLKKELANIEKDNLLITNEDKSRAQREAVARAQAKARARSGLGAPMGPSAR